MIYRFLWRDLVSLSGERGIRTPGGVTLNSFQDCRIRPLCHFSKCLIRYSLNAGANIESFFYSIQDFIRFYSTNYHETWPYLRFKEAK